MSTEISSTHQGAVASSSHARPPVQYQSQAKRDPRYLRGLKYITSRIAAPFLRLRDYTTRPNREKTQQPPQHIRLRPQLQRVDARPSLEHDSSNHTDDGNESDSEQVNRDIIQRVNISDGFGLTPSLSLIVHRPSQPSPPPSPPPSPAPIAATRTTIATKKNTKLS
jgi:hypothetical protein